VSRDEPTYCGQIVGSQFDPGLDAGGDSPARGRRRNNLSGVVFRGERAFFIDVIQFIIRIDDNDKIAAVFSNYP
jgi:hypothetical protein